MHKNAPVVTLLFISCFIISCLLSAICQASEREARLNPADIAEKKVLTVGSLDMNYIPYLAINAKSKINGIYPEYIQYLAQQLGMQVHYIVYKRTSELEAAMQEGRIDIALGLQITPKRQSYLTLSKPFLSVPRNLLIARELATEPFKLKNNSKIKLALFRFDVEKQFIRQQFPNIIKFELSRYSDIEPALAYKLANAHLSDALTNQYLASQLHNEEFTTVTLDDLPEKQWRIPLLKHNSELNKAINQLIINTATVTMSAVVARASQWQNYHKKSQILITEPQQDWLAQHPVLRYTTLPHWQSVNMSSDSDKPVGLAISVLNLIASNLGVSLEYVPANSEDEALLLINSGQVDLIPAVLKTKQRSTLMNFSEPYLTTSWGMLVRNDSPLNIHKIRQGKYKVASPNGDFAQVIMRNYFTHNKLIKLNNMQTSLEQLERGKVDVVITTLASAQLWLEQDNAQTYKLLPNLLINGNADIQLGVSQHAPLLLDLVDQALQAIGHDELEALSRSWLDLSGEQNINIQKYITYAALIAAILIIIVLAFGFWNRKLHLEVAYRRAAQKRALSAEQKLSSIANAIPGAVVQFIISDNQLNFTYASQGIEGFTPCKQINLSTDQNTSPLENDFFTLILPEQIEKLKRAATQAMLDQQGIDFECQLKSPYYHWVNLVAFPSKEDGHNVWNGVLLEINERKQHEIALKAEKLKAEKATQAKTQFLARMSHEIRTPLSGVITATELLAQSQLDNQQRDDINTIITSAHSLLYILNDVLDHSKMETQQFSVEEIPADLLIVVEQAICTHIASAHEKDLQLKFYFDPQTNRAVKTDPVRLQQVLSNLISNAVKFTEQGTIAIHVLPLTRDDKQQQVKFSIIDTGIGIDSLSQQKLFTPYTQARSDTTRQYGGTGLGLSICRMLIERLGGKIDLSSQLGQGTEFNFIIPLECYKPNVAPVINEALPLIILDDGSDYIAQLVHYLKLWQVKFTLLTEAAEQTAWLSFESPATSLVIYHQLDDITSLAQSPQQLIKVKLSSPYNSEYGADYYLSTNPLLVSPLLDLLSKQRHEQSQLVMQRDELRRTPLKAQSKAQAIATERLILVAEDHPTNRKVLKRQLESLGYYADYVENGVQALQALEQQNYNLLITDCHMPELDGYELTRRLRDSGYTIPIIALTANALIGEADHCLAMGMNGYISKPVSLATLQAKLNKYLPNIEQNTDLAHINTSEVVAAQPELPLKLTELQTMFGSVDDVLQLLSEFISSSKHDLYELSNAAANDNFMQLSSIAHRFKGAAKMVLAERLAELADELELAANQQQTALCLSHIQALYQTLADYEHSIKNATK
ncbi:transporter substrate-binding domain-containing protein [uncultured Pseudoalteromonas sp.]|uniref:transporter substrate-binding domain-containing protein n=1 Tax=unclassified Pseudoalteromonas TaxID=194690 RepID=UPI0030DA5FC5|tara:strand:+ start:14975 stop:18970 length:3996 start_codon:yes stop_codon:yes gene_type:complete